MTGRASPRLLLSGPVHWAGPPLLQGLHSALKVLRQRRIRPANGGEGVGEVRLEDLRAGRRGKSGRR